MSPFLSIFRLFRPGVVPTIAAAVVIATTILLGNWQYRRASFRAGLQAQAIAASREPIVSLKRASEVTDPMRYRRVAAAGSYEPDHQIWLDNRIHKGVAGYYVLTPLTLEDGSHVLVDRGWVAAPKMRDSVPGAPPPVGPVTVIGRLNVPPPSFLALSNTHASGAVWQNLDLAEYSRVHHIDLAPLVIEEMEVRNDGLVRERLMPDFGRDTNIGYMWQWYSFAGLTLVLWIVLGFRSGSRPRARAPARDPNEAAR